MDRLLISGNGIFLKKNPSLSRERINVRFVNNFKLFSDGVLGPADNAFRLLYNDLKPLNMISYGDGFSAIPNTFYNAFSNYDESDDYEKMLGESIDILLGYLAKKEEYYGAERSNHFFTVIYEKFINIIQAVLFMELPDEKPQTIIFPEVFQNFTHYTFNILMNKSFDYYLHGQFDLKKWTYNIDQELMDAGGKQNEDDLVLIAECIHPSPLSYSIPMIFGKNIKQKNIVLKKLKGYKETKNLKINEAFKRNIPYLRLGEDAADKEVHILGVSVETHIEILNILDKANKIYWYWFSETDLEFLNTIDNEKLIIKKYDEFQ